MAYRRRMDYDEQYETVWAELDEIEPEDFVERIDSIDAPPEIAAFERAAARDSTGHSDLAVPLYREALAGGVVGLRRRRTVIQLASSLRNLGELDESLALLESETDAGDDDLDVALAAFRALTLASLGRDREGLAHLLGAIAPTLPRYQRSVANYARALVDPAG